MVLYHESREQGTNVQALSQNSGHIFFPWLRHGRPQHIRYLLFSVGSVSPEIGQISCNAWISVGSACPNDTLISGQAKVTYMYTDKVNSRHVTWHQHLSKVTIRDGLFVLFSHFFVGVRRTYIWSQLNPKSKVNIAIKSKSSEIIKSLNPSGGEYKLTA